MISQPGVAYRPRRGFHLAYGMAWARAQDGSRRDVVLFWGLACLIACHFTVAYIRGTDFYVALPDYVRGASRLPFQFRALTGWVMRGMLALAHLPPARAPSVLAPVVGVSVLGILAMLRAVARPVLGPGWAGVAALGFAGPLYVMFVAPAYEYRFSYPYDLPSLALFCAALLLFLRGRMLGCACVFALAALSRETCVLLIAVVLLWPEPARRGRWLLAIGLAAIWLAAWVLVHRLYGGNPRESAFMRQIGAPGATVIELGNNWQDLRDPGSWPALLSIFGWMWVPVFLYWKRIRHAGVQRCILLLTPAWWLLMFTVGRLREVRVFSELTVLYWFALVLILSGVSRPREPVQPCQ